MSDWISVSDRLPDHGQDVIFVVNSKKYLQDYNGRVLGGRFVAGEFGGFAVPGILFSASHWQPMPEPPK